MPVGDTLLWEPRVTDRKEKLEPVLVHEHSVEGFIAHDQALQLQRVRQQKAPNHAS